MNMFEVITIEEVKEAALRALPEKIGWAKARLERAEKAIKNQRKTIEADWASFVGSPGWEFMSITEKNLYRLYRAEKVKEVEKPLIGPKLALKSLERALAALTQKEGAVKATSKK